MIKLETQKREKKVAECNFTSKIRRNYPHYSINFKLKLISFSYILHHIYKLKELNLLISACVELPQYTAPLCFIEFMLLTEDLIDVT